ncbi:MAG: thiamine-phosphate kinase [Deltaproteobacteria bacterium]|nr:MAG: thiamine-phosphate kinase [Deltaproteobacteria bacterium]
MRDEFAKIEWLKTRFDLDGDSKKVLVSIGDDAAVIDFGNRPTIITVDTQVEDVHFRRDLISSRDLGFRAMVAAASDVWAMAAMPSAAVVALTLPPDFPDEEFRELIEGLAEAARITGARVVGGNLSQGASLSVTTTVFGLPIAEPVTRHGAQAGDSVYVTGTLGSAALGLAILQAGAPGLEHAASFVDRWKRPPTNGHVAKGLADFATAAVDVSDGCLQDLHHVCAASGVGATLRADAIPASPGYQSICEALELDPVVLALTGGEDYELIFTAPESSEASALGTKIGEIIDGSGVEVVDEAGRVIDIERTGFRHFS